MRRRFQFSLRVIFAIMAVVAAGSAIFMMFPLAVRFTIGAIALGIFLWLLEEVMGWRELLDAIVRGGSRHKYIIKRRRDDAGATEQKE
jgi:hypothetical protein